MLIVIILMMLILSCANSTTNKNAKMLNDSIEKIEIGDSTLTDHSDEIIINEDGQVVVTVDTVNFKEKYKATKFVYPVNHGKNLNGYTEAFGFFQKNREGNMHLGTDISKPGEADFGDTLYSISNGKVILVLTDILMLLHKTEKQYLISVYRHCNEIFVIKGQYIQAAQPVGTIGNCNGAYVSHLHLELRENISLGIETGYSSGKKPIGYLNPMKFIKEHE
jgi:hypothetical protein